MGHDGTAALPAGHPNYAPDTTNPRDGPRGIITNALLDDLRCVHHSPYISVMMCGGVRFRPVAGLQAIITYDGATQAVIEQAVGKAELSIPVHVRSHWYP